jgi:pilus assembly protein FimV
MSLKLRAAITALLLAPQAAFSLGLGDIRLSSALNEPLSAEIDLVAPTSEELGSLSAQLASRDLFQRYGLDRPAYLDTVQFAVGMGRDGRNVLRVNSAAPINEPFVTFLVEVSWPRGRLLREYTVLLDPPVFAPKEAAPPAPVVAPRSTQPATAEPRAQPASPRPAAQAGEMPSSYVVQRGDTLYRVASRYAGGGAADTNRMMIAMFRANPDAFGGNINILRSGAILRVPGPEAVADVSAGEAAGEIGRQTAAWRGGETPREPPRLRLVTPTEAAPAATAAAPAEGGVDSQITELSREIEESRRLLELKSAKLAELQQRAAEAAAAQTAAEAPPVAEPQAPPAAEPEAPVAQAPAAGPEKPAVPEAPEKPTPAKKKAVTPAVSEPGFLDNLTDNWQYVLGGAVLLLGGGLAFGYMRRRREQDLGESVRSFDIPISAPVPSETARLRALAQGEVIGTATEEQELEDFRTSTIPPAGKTAQDYGATIETKRPAEAPIDLDQGDPLAEADFHMAYGLYDQAADIVKLALDKEPERRDYKLKLLEIFFVAGDKQHFVETARDLEATRSGGDAAEWDRVLIMGRQLAPEERMFAGAAASSGVDLNLEGGDSRVDLELLTPPGGDSIDIDLGEALAAADSGADTGEAESLDFDLDRAGGADSPTAEMPRLSDDTGELPRLADRTAEMAPLTESTAEMPTLEVPVGHDRTVEATRLQPSSHDVTAEMPMDDLGIDVSELGALAEPRPEDDVTQVAQHVEATHRLPAGAEPMDFDLSDLAAGDGQETQRLRVDVGHPMDEPEAEADYSKTEEVPVDQLPSMSELEPVTMSEVGTKLDLARAYLDMGDPDGARSILDEVLKEGSTSQKQEARRLLDSLPGV